MNAKKSSEMFQCGSAGGKCLIIRVKILLTLFHGNIKEYFYDKS